MDALQPSAAGPSDAERLERIHAARPDGGLFAGKDWLWSPRPFVLSRHEWKLLEKLGPLLWKFVQACDNLYHRSAKGKLPPWIAAYADAGKPAWLIEAARANHREGEWPRVLRPDLVLTAGGFAMSELDSVPGGIGLLGWLNRTHAALGDKVIGGPDGMIDGFASLFSGPGVIAVSKESADYRPEMDWLAARLRDSGCDITVEDAESLEPDGREIYRFFELFDWENLPSFRPLLEKWKDGTQPVTAPFKPWLDEKLWLALLWSAPLQDHWDLLLRRAWKETLQSIVPFGWVIDPTPLPPHGVLPRLGVHSWEAVAGLSQKHRELVLKVSGFHPLAWGARSVTIGHDVPHDVWAGALRAACDDFPRAPWILQEFHHARIVRHPYQDRDTGTIVEMEAKARITPYYFAGRDGKIRLGGVHATLCPSDKKILHGMKDSIMVPCVVEE
jgi:hypothetical protein